MVTNKKDVNGPYYNTTVVVQWFRNGEMVAREHPRKDLKMLKH